MWRYQCRYFLSDRPCKIRKDKPQINCRRCKYFFPFKEKILIIKLAAPGDVLRTTFLLNPLKRKFPHSQIYWLTSRPSDEILQLNPLVDKIILWPENALLYLLTENFDLVINLDLSEPALLLGRLTRSKNILGFFRDKNGRLGGSNPAAEYWLQMSLDDGLKKANQKTYQEIMSEILNLPAAARARPLIQLPESSRRFARQMFHKWKLAGNKIVGLNPGAGRRWPLKQWTTEGYLALIKGLLKKPEIKILLLGGETEQELLNTLARKSKSSRVIHTGSNSLKDFFALIDRLNLLVTTDSLALHAGLALGKKVVAIFGPTSSTEIEMYNLGQKVVTPLKCRVCYRTSCDKHPNCMEAIEPNQVIAAVEALL